MKLDWKTGMAISLLAVSIGVGVKIAQPPKAAKSVTPPSSAKPPPPAAQAIFQLVTKPDLAKWQPLLDDSLPWQKRLLLTEHIRAGISPAEVEFLFSALDHTPSTEQAEPWWVILNEIMERLRKHGLGAEQYAERLGKIAADSQRPEVARDYAIQHLLQWISPADSKISPGETVPAIRSQTLALIAGIIRDPSLRHSSISGTALLALADASSRLPSDEVAASWDALDSFLSPLIAGGSDASLSLHISAIQAAALTGRTAHLPATRRLAMDENTDPSLRLTSIAALGLYGAEDSREFLESVSLEGSRYSYAAKSALDRLDQHLAGTSK